MAKLALLALLAAFLVVTDATIVRTTITTTEFEEENRHSGSSTQQQQQCSPRQIQGKRFNSCQQYLTQSSRRSYDILRVVDVNPFSQEKEMLEECCNELKELRNPQCACEALKKIIREEREQGSRYEGEGQKGQQGRQMVQKAKNIPQQCRIPIEGRCRIEEY